MAKSKGLLKIEGTLDGMTFYKSQDGHMVRTKGGVSAKRIATDTAFARTRENMAEFSEAASTGKLFRSALRVLTANASDSRLTSRVVKLMTQVKNLDGISARGSRLVSVGLVTPEGKAAVKGMNFNPNSALASVLYKPFTVDAATGKIDFKGLLVANDVAVPAGATHITIKGAFAKIDFVGGKSELQLTNAVNIAVDAPPTDVALVPQAVPVLAAGVSLMLLGIDFFQAVNGIQYSLKNGSFNALSIVEVA